MAEREKDLGLLVLYPLHLDVVLDQFVDVGHHRRLLDIQNDEGGNHVAVETEKASETLATFRTVGSQWARSS